MNLPSPPRTPTRLSDGLSCHLATNGFVPCFAVTLIVVSLFGASAQAQILTTLHSFEGGSDGGFPSAGVIEDPVGNLYGMTPYGGSSYNGVVFVVRPGGTETVLYGFGFADGADPYSPLIRDHEGNLYGATWTGGTSGQGTVFEIIVSGVEIVLHSFDGGTTDGCYPDGGLAMDQYENLYGTTYECGANNYGTVFEVSRRGAPYKLLHSFSGKDGAHPVASPILDPQDNLYGVTSGGGSADAGAVYKLTPAGITVLHAFRGRPDGASPSATPSMDEYGNLYGTTEGGGARDYGTVWSLSQNGEETVLHSFVGGTIDGCSPYGGVVADSNSNLYGSTVNCGAHNGGTLWELTGHKLTLLHSFAGPDGLYPEGDLLRGTNGELYGTTRNGGSAGQGTVWSYVP